MGKDLLLGFIRGYIGDEYIVQTPTDILTFMIECITLLEAVVFDVFNPRNCQRHRDAMYAAATQSPKAYCYRLFISSKGYNKGVVFWKLKYFSYSCVPEGGI